MANAIYLRAKSDPSIDLTILSALTLSRPSAKGLIEKRFFDPFNQRHFGNFPEPLYEHDRLNGILPSNITICEFYYPPGKFLNNERAQRNYISSNYSHAARDIVARGVNVIAQIVAPGVGEDEGLLSLSCNPDLTLDVVSGVKNLGKQIIVIAQINRELPFMYGDARVPCDFFDYILDHPELEHKLFAPPKLSISDQDYMIALYASALVRDGGELQIGIGSLGDAIVSMLVMRHKDNQTYRELISKLSINPKFEECIEKIGGVGPFSQGLFGASEMMVDGFLPLIQEGIVKREVYDNPSLQRLINAGLISDEVTPKVLKYLMRRNEIHDVLLPEEFYELQEYGVFKDEIKYSDGKIVLPDGTNFIPDLKQPAVKDLLLTQCLGTKLKRGSLIHAAFFLGSSQFYQALREMPVELRKKIRMRSVLRVNEIIGHEEIDRLHRRDGRFINTCMMTTLAGASTSDALENGQIISGVGGQFNFVAQAHTLNDGRSLLLMRATGSHGGPETSNILPFYGHITVPKHMRDIVITEYGVADLRGKTDEEVVISLIEIADSRYQEQLIKWAKKNKKLKKDYKLPDYAMFNTAQKIKLFLSPYKKKGLFSAFPLGCDFTPVELKIGKALKYIKHAKNHRWPMLPLLFKAIFSPKVHLKVRFHDELERMRFHKVNTLQEWFMSRLLLEALEASQKG
ncbi:MAG: hypothetical protein Fur0010_08500 [Bdellovibrio sp.]